MDAKAEAKAETKDVFDGSGFAEPKGAAPSAGANPSCPWSFKQL